MSNRKQYFLIVDGSSLLATSYYATLPRAARKEKDEIKKEQMLRKMLPKGADGQPVNALRQFFHTIYTILRYQQPSHLAICWDISRNTFRKELWPAYKANRSATPETLKCQFEAAYAICEELGFIQIRHQMYEADDFAGTLAACMEPYMEVRILTRDKDYFQLISDRTRIWYGMVDLSQVKAMRRQYQMPSHLPSKVIEVDPSVLQKEFGWTPQGVRMLKALFGDTSDNIPGVSGMGEARSVPMSLHYSTPQELYAELESVRCQKHLRDLQRKWRSWGIYKSPYRVLMRKGDGRRLSAKEMCFLCYDLGRIRTDIDLEPFLNAPFSPDLFRLRPVSRQTIQILERHAIHVAVLEQSVFRTRKKKTASSLPVRQQTPKKSFKARTADPAGIRNKEHPEKTGQKYSASQKQNSGSGSKKNPGRSRQKKRSDKESALKIPAKNLKNIKTADRMPAAASSHSSLQPQSDPAGPSSRSRRNSRRRGRQFKRLQTNSPQKTSDTALPSSLSAELGRQTQKEYSGSERSS